MDEIEQRLRESTDAFIKSFENWVGEKKSLESREALMECMHEVRKVVSRVEIEIAISERDRLGSRPIPIPPHRSQRKRNEGGDEIEGDDDNNGNFNVMDNGDQGAPRQPRRQQHGGGRGRRPMPNRGGGTQGGGE